MGTVFNQIRRKLDDAVVPDSFNGSAAAMKYFQGLFTHYFDARVLEYLQSRVMYGIQLISGMGA
jgi:hypothetical protein